MKYYYKILVVMFIYCFSLSCEKELSVTPKIDKYEYGKIYISSKPTGAKIFIDGKNMEKVTPDTISWLDYGEQEVVLKLDYFKDYKAKINIKKDVFNIEFFDFFDLPDVYGSLMLSANTKEANVYYNDKLVGKTPYFFNKLLPGKQNIKIEKIGFISKEFSIEVFSGLNNPLYVDLIDTTKMIKYSNLGYDLGSIYSSGYNPELDLSFFSSNNGNYFLSNNKIFPFNSTNEINKKRIFTFLTSEKNISRAITDKEIFILKNSNWENDNYLNSILNNRTLFSLDENEDIICMGTDNGATIIKEGNTIEINTTNSIISNNRITNVLVLNKDYIYLFTAEKDAYVYYKGFIYNWPYKIDVKKVFRWGTNNYFIITYPLLNGPITVYPEELQVYSYSSMVLRFNYLYFSNKLNNFKLNSIRLNQNGEIFVASNLGVTPISKSYQNLGAFKGYLDEVIDLHFTNNNDVIFSTRNEGIIRYKQ